MEVCTDCDVVIVGAGAAGLAAALYVQRFGLNAIVLEKLAPGGQLTSANLIENYPGFPEGISGYELIERFRRHAEAFGAKIVTDTIKSLERCGDRWRLLGTEREYVASAVIIATGARHRPLGVPGEKEFAGKGVSVCATCDGFFYRGKRVAVVGGGNVAIDDALYLSELAQQVYVIHRRNELRAEKVLQERAFARPNIELVWDSVVTRVNGTQTVESVTAHNVKTDADREIPVDGVFVAIGFQPEVALVQDLVATEDGHILTNGRMATSAEGLFAAGDIRQLGLKQIATAVGDGALAADAAYKYITARRSAPGTMPSPELPETLTWSVRPCARNPALGVAVAAFVLVVSFGVQVLCGSLWWGLLALALLSLSVASYFAETTYEVNREGAVARGLSGAHRRAWSEVRGRFADRDGVLLSPRRKPSRLAYTRGLYLRFGDNRDEVLRRVEAFVESAAGDIGDAEPGPRPGG